MKKFKKKFKYGTLKDKILIILMMVLIALVTLFILFCAYVIISAPSISEERLYKGNSTVLYDINGNEFARLGSENREKITYDELPEVLVDAIVATEDSRFFQHNGIDIARFTKAVFGQLAGNSSAGGGSTLTMQVSKNAATSTTSTGIKGLVRKFQDIYLSVFVFEKKFTKEQIIEFYVNIPNLGAGAYGVEQASQVYFGKSVKDLNLSEAALIAGLFQAPSSYNPYNHPVAATKRRDLVLDLMYRHGYITEEERDAAKSVDVESMLVGKASDLNKYQGYVDTVVEEVLERTGNDPYNVSMKIYTTMDPSAQDLINQIYHDCYDTETDEECNARLGEQIYTWDDDTVQAGIAVVSVEDGSLVAIGAGRNKTQERSFNYATDASRHPGSTAKPVVDYGPAIEYLDWSTGQTLIDDETTYKNGTSIKNWDNSYTGLTTAKVALAQSRNIPALVTFEQTTNEQKAEFAKNMGWTLEDDGAGTILETCSIGGFEGVTPVESAAAYATFARGGTYIEPHSFTSLEYTETGETYEVEPETHVVMSDSTAYMITAMLKYAITSGNVSAGNVSGTDIAAKTGTSTVDAAKKKALGLENTSVILDSWEVSYSPDYAISVWYGYPNLTKEHWLSNSNGGRARKALTKLLDNGIMKKNSTFTQPSSVETATIELETDPLQLASDYTPDNLKSVEYFKKGTAPTEVSTRFSQLSDPSNLKYTATDSSVTLSWTAASIPDQMNSEYLTNYFNNSAIYNRWADKYRQQRIEYNNSTFGTFGYRVYMQNASGTKELGYTTSTSFTANVTVDANTTFIVKSSYEKFTANMSGGIKVQAKANSSTQTTTQAASGGNTNFAIEYVGPSCSTVQTFNDLGSSPSNKVRVTLDGADITSKSSISYECYNSSDKKIDCNTLTNGQKYQIKVTVKYNNTTKQKDINLSSSC